MNLERTLRFLHRNCQFYSTTVKPFRLLRCNMRTATNVSVSRSQRDRDTFQEVLPIVINTVTEDKRFSEVPKVGNWLRKFMEYNLTGGKLNRGLTTVFAYEMFEKPQNITEDSIRSARILGWCVEMLQSYFLVQDDMMDGSTTRRGAPCWYRRAGVGLGAINDCVLLHGSIYHVLRTHFRHAPCYIQIVELFNSTLLNTSIGQHIDFEMAHRNSNDYSLFSIEQYNAIAKYKTAFYTYKLPVSLGLYLTSNNNEEAHDRIEDLCIDIGIFFQMQDDYIDCFGDESVTGKMGTDIQEGKCSWLAVKALEKCNSAQRVVFESCYGSKEPAHVERIKRLYDQLEIEQVYRDEERRYYELINKKIQALPEDLSPALFTKLIDVLFKRKA